MTYQSVNPNDGKVLKSFEHLNSAQLEQSLASAESCFQAWKHTNYVERAAVLHKAHSRSCNAVHRAFRAVSEQGRPRPAHPA